MHNLLINTVALLNNSIHYSYAHQMSQILCDKQTVRNSIKYDYKQNAFISTIALKLQIPASTLIANISEKDVIGLFKDVVVKDEKIILYLHHQAKYALYDEIFKKVVLGTFGRLQSKSLIINVQHQFKSSDDLSFIRSSAYTEALINLLMACNYSVRTVNEIPVLQFFTIINELKNYIYENDRTLYFNGKILLINGTFTEYANYLFTYVSRCLEINSKAVTICSNGVSVRPLLQLNKNLSFKYSLVKESEPVTIKINGKKHSSNDLSLDAKINLDEFKYACVAHQIDKNFIYHADQPNNLDFVRTTFKKIQTLLVKIDSMINNQWLKTEKWVLFKNDELLLNYIAKFDMVLEWASKNLNLSVVERYLFQLCRLAKNVIRMTEVMLNHINNHQQVDLQKLRSKIRILIILKYVINFILNVFNVKVK